MSSHSFSDRCAPIRRAALLLVPCLFAGCGGSNETCYPVAGMLRLDGKPVAEAVVVLHPAGGQLPGLEKARGVSDGQGRYRISTFGEFDGAPAGEYLVTVELRAPVERGEDIVRTGAHLLLPEFADRSTSPLRCTVNNLPTEIPQIDFKSPPKRR